MRVIPDFKEIAKGVINEKASSGRAGRRLKEIGMTEMHRREKRLFSLGVTIFLLVLLCGCSKKVSDSSNEELPQKVIVAYVTSWSQVLPDPTVMTHLNYAFGHMADSFDGVKIDNPERFSRLIELKKENPNLKILLSIGGWGSGRFSEMAASVSLRNAFAQDCRRIIEEYGIDGIDIDWEYPTIGWAGISNSPDDTENFTKLMHAVRKEIGKDKLLTMASSATAKYVDFKAISPVIDFVNLMTYDMSDGHLHHSALYPSSITPEFTSSLSVKAHKDAGLSNNQIVLGMPFYGRGIREGETFYYDYKNIEIGEGESISWDPEARVPFLADSIGNFVFGFDNPRSIAIKCDYILENDLKGAMYWDYNGDDSIKSLSKTIYKTLFETK